MREVKVPFSEMCGFTPWQWEATEIADAHLYTLAGGTRGPGKSHWARWWLLRRLLELKEQSIEAPTVGLFCEDYPTLRDRQIKKIAIEFPRAMGKVKSTQDAGLGFHLHDGGMIALRNLDDPSKYVGAEFAAIVVDEITKSPLDTFNILRGSLRWPGVERCPFHTTGNPGGIGHLWVKQYWIDGVLPSEMEELRDEFAYVRGTPDDNPHLDPAYWEMLRTLPPALSRAWLEGDWDVFEGQVFSEWRRELHVIDPVVIPKQWVRWRSVDWGYAAPMCCLWLARNPDTLRVWVYRELYEAGLTDPEQAERIRQMTPGDERIRMTLADPSMWTKRTTERDTTSSADVYAEHGVRLTKADNDRLIGKRRVHDALQVVDGDGEFVHVDGLPGLQMFENCRNLIRTLPALPYDDVRVEDVDTDAEDHPYDTLRYGLARKVPGHRRSPKRGKRDYWAAARH